MIDRLPFDLSEVELNRYLQQLGDNATKEHKSKGCWNSSPKKRFLGRGGLAVSINKTFKSIQLDLLFLFIQVSYIYKYLGKAPVLSE